MIPSVPTSDSLVEDINQLKIAYDAVFMPLYKRYLDGMKNVHDVSFEEKFRVSEQLRLKAKESVLSAHPEFDVLQERGLI